MKIYYDPEEKEVWKLIPNSKGYCVSSFGNVKRLERKVWIKQNNCWGTVKEHMLTPSYNNSKHYARIAIIYKDRGKVIESVHRLVAREFVINPNINKFDQVNHLDLNPKNNHWRNLQWCTNQMNMDHSWKYSKARQLNKDGTSLLGIRNRKLTEGQVKEIPNLLRTLKVSEIAKLYGVRTSTISEIIHGRSWPWLNLDFS